MTNPLPAPQGVALWMYTGGEAHETWRASRETVRAVRPQSLILHGAPDPGDEATVRAIRAEHPDLPLYLAAPANGLADDPIPRAVETVRAWATRCASWGATGLILNAEGASAPGRAGWKPGQPKSLDDLRELATAITRAIREAAPHLVLGISSHDVPDYHHLPWRDLLALADVHLPQQYCAGCASVRGAMGRALLGEPGWRRLADHGAVPAHVAPEGDGWWPAYQSHSVPAVASLAVAWRWPSSAWWATPSRLDDAGREVVTTLAAAHRAGAWMPLRDLQAALGVTVDGAWGPATYVAMRRWLGLAPHV